MWKDSSKGEKHESVANDEKGDVRRARLADYGISDTANERPRRKRRRA